MRAEEGFHILSFKIHTLLVDIIKVAYPDDRYPNNKFSKFFIEIISKEMKTIHGRYYPAQKKIEIFNLSRPTGHVVTTTIHEVAHHIDYCLRRHSDHTDTFYEVMYTLLIKAMGMGIITKKDILSASDSADRERLTKYFGDIELWEVKPIEYKQNIITVKVKNCFPIKDILKSRGYKYSSIEQIWEKNIHTGALSEEKVFLQSLISLNNVTFIRGSQINIRAIYYISVISMEVHEEYLKANGYIYNGYNMKNKAWNKKIEANNLEDELRKVSKLRGVKVKVKGIK